MTVLEPVRAHVARRQAEGRRRVRLAEVVEATGLPRRPVLRVLDKLTAEGYLRELFDAPQWGGNGPPRRNPTWSIVGERSVLERPRARPRKHTLRDKMWHLMRSRRRFVRSEIQTLSGASAGSVERYVEILEREGLIRRVGKQGAELLYLLVKDPGPRRPRLAEVATHE